MDSEDFCNIEICKFIKNNINKLCHTEIDEIFKIIHNNNSKYTQNNNGIFINLNWLDETILMQIYNYINFCLKSQSEINKYELMKNMLNDTIINKEKIEEKPEILLNTSNNTTLLVSKNKVSSSMKFYLLKKRYLKKNIIVPSIIDNILTHEEYLIY